MSHPSKRGTRVVASLALAGLVSSSFVPAAMASETPAPSSSVSDLGPLISGKAAMHTAAFGQENGKPVAYQISNRAAGETGSAVLTVFDHVTGTQVRTRVLPGAFAVERVHVANDGNVYLSANNGLWQYSPNTTKMRHVAKYGNYARQIASDGDSNVYVAAAGGEAKTPLGIFNPKDDTFSFTAVGEALNSRAVAAEGDTLYLATSTASAHQIIKRNLTTGEDQIIATTANWVGSLAIAGNYLVVFESNTNTRFLNLTTNEWAQDNGGAEIKLATVQTGETPQRDGKVILMSANTLRIVDGNDPQSLNITDTGVRFATNAMRGTTWAGESGTEALYAVQGTGHVSHFDLASKKETLVQPKLQNHSHPLGALGQTASGNIFAASTLNTDGVIYTPAARTVTSRASLGGFTDSVVHSNVEYVVTNAGAVARVSVESGGAPEVVFTPAEGEQVASVVSGSQGLLILVNGATGSRVVNYSPLAGSTTELVADLSDIQLNGGTAVGNKTFLSGTNATGAVLVPIAANGAIEAPRAISSASGQVANATGLSSPDGVTLWAAIADGIAEINTATGVHGTVVDFSAALGTTESSDTKEARWYGDNLFVADEGGIVKFDRETSEVSVTVKTDEDITSWELVAGESAAGIYFLSALNPSNLRTVGVEFDPEAGGSDGGEVGPIQTTMPGVEFGEEANLGVPVPIAAIIDMAFGTLNGRTVGYTATSSDGSLLNVLDVASNRVIDTAFMESVIQVWKIEVAPNGKVYIAAIGQSPESTQRGELWIYDPVTKDLKMAGVVPGASSLWSMAIDENSNAYIGTYKTGDVIKYSAQDGSFTSFGQVSGQEYVRSIEYHDGYVYAGTGTLGTVVKIDVADPTDREVISEPLLELFNVSELPWAYDMQKVGKWLLVNFSGGLKSTAFYNLETGEWSSNLLTPASVTGVSTAGNPGFTQLVERNGKVYLGHNGSLVEVDLTGSDPQFKATPIAFPLGLRGQAWLDLSEQGLEGEWLVTATRQGPLRAMNVETGVMKTLTSQIQTQNGTPLHNVNLNAEGGLYFVTYPAANGAEYNTKTGEYSRFAAEQAESFLTVGDTTYAGMYPGGFIETFKKDATGKVEIKHLFDLENDQDRPYYMVEDGGKIFIGSIPGYEKHNGALSIYDIATGDLTVEAGIVENQSVVGIAVKGDTVWGSTTIVGGLGADPIATEAKLFKYSISTGEKIGEYSLKLPSGQKPKHISALSFGPDGNLWGTTDGYLFVVNPDTMEIIPEKTINIYPEVSRYGMWRPMSFQWDNGLLYINVASRLTVVNPATMEYRQLSTKGEELARFIIADLAPEVSAAANESAPKIGEEATSAQRGLYFFGSAASDKLRVYPMYEVPTVTPEPEPEPEPEPAEDIELKRLAAPSVVGTTTVGKTLKVKAPKWNATGVKNTYQWFANGQRIKSATGTSLALTASHVGKRISVTATGTKVGYTTGVTSSRWSAKVGKASSKVSAKLSKTTLKSSSVTLTVQVSVPTTSKPTGTVYVRVGDKRVSASVKSSHKGTVKVSLKAKSFKAGKNQKVYVSFKPNGSTAKIAKSSKSTYVGKLTVIR